MIIGISGKKQSGKDTVAKIIQGLILGEKNFENGILGFLASYDDYLDYPNKKWEIKKFAGTLKEIVSILTGFKVEDLEKEAIKNSNLFLSYKLLNKKANTFEIFASMEDLVERLNHLKTVYLDIYSAEEVNDIFVQETISITPRLLLQTIGTDIVRTINPNIWVNKLMNDYISYADAISGTSEIKKLYPNWIITDTRFPNEVKAIKEKDGITIRINRESDYNSNHSSETALDDYEDFDYTIDNNNCIDCLIEKVKEILKHEKII